MFIEIIKAVLMGIVEGITEWLPVSSTGHMILLEQLVHFNASEEFLSMFRVVIQLGAILAVVVLFWKKLWPFGIRRGRVSPKPAVFGLWVKVIVATLPALLVSPLDDWMEARFYNHITVAAMLILYGILFIWVENRPAAPRSGRPMQIGLREALIIGIWQVLAIIPGTSRSGSTILGAMLLSCSRFVATEFSFFMAVPVMFGASGYKILKFVLKTGLASITGFQWGLLLLGSLVSFVVSLIAIKFLMNYIRKHDFTAFGWYRIVLGAIVLLYFGIFA